MIKQILLLLLLLSVLLLQCPAVGYDAQREEDNLLKSGQEISWAGSIYRMTWAIYEAIKEQNQLTKEQTHAIWVSTCYAPHSGVGYGSGFYTSNFTGLENECAKAGYPTKIYEKIYG